MSAPTTLTVTFTNGTGSPATLPIRPNTDYNNAIHNIFLYGGFWMTIPSGASAGVLQFVPWSAITSVTAQ